VLRVVGNTDNLSPRSRTHATDRPAARKLMISIYCQRLGFFQVPEHAAARNCFCRWK
jgi:hypothetical protein